MDNFINEVLGFGFWGIIVLIRVIGYLVWGKILCKLIRWRWEGFGIKVF